MNDKNIKRFMAFNVWLLKISKGRLGSKLGRQRILLLETSGRKTGKPRTIPIAYFEQAGEYIIVASNWSRDQQANWYLNLKHDPHAKLGIRGRTFSVLAREARGEEYESLWEFVCERHPPYETYQGKTSRRIPIMVFTPDPEAAPSR